MQLPRRVRRRGEPRTASCRARSLRGALRRTPSSRRSPASTPISQRLSASRVGLLPARRRLALAFLARGPLHPWRRWPTRPRPRNSGGSSSHSLTTRSATSRVTVSVAGGLAVRADRVQYRGLGFAIFQQRSTGVPGTRSTMALGVRRRAGASRPQQIIRGLFPPKPDTLGPHRPMTGVRRSGLARARRRSCSERRPRRPRPG